METRVFWLQLLKSPTSGTHISLRNSHRGSSGRSYSGMDSLCAELRRVVMRTRGVLEFMDELESVDTYGRKEDWLITAV